jgi:hypothetical protein
MISSSMSPAMLCTVSKEKKIQCILMHSVNDVVYDILMSDQSGSIDDIIDLLVEGHQSD